MKLWVFQECPLDVNLQTFADSRINIDYDDKGVLIRGFNARHKGGRAVRWSRHRIGGGLPMWKTRQFFLKNYPRQRFCLTNIQARGLKPADIREWTEDLYIYPQYVDLFHSSTWYWPQWLASFAAIGIVLAVFDILVRRRRRKKAASA